MPTLVATVGKKEKHNIRIEASLWSGRFSVFVDEKEVSKTYGNLKDRAFFKIGGKENMKSKQLQKEFFNQKLSAL